MILARQSEILLTTSNSNRYEPGLAPAGRLVSVSIFQVGVAIPDRFVYRTFIVHPGRSAESSSRAFLWQGHGKWMMDGVCRLALLLGIFCSKWLQLGCELPTCPCQTMEEAGR